MRGFGPAWTRSETGPISTDVGTAGKRHGSFGKTDVEVGYVESTGFDRPDPITDRFLWRRSPPDPRMPQPSVRDFASGPTAQRLGADHCLPVGGPTEDRAGGRPRHQRSRSARHEPRDLALAADRGLASPRQC